MRPEEKPPSRSMLHRWRLALLAKGKRLAWRGLDGTAFVLQRVASWSGRTAQVGTIIYKVDRLGDWLFAEQSVARIVHDAQQRGESVLLWASRESTSMRDWLPVACEVETFSFEPKNWRARVGRTLSLLRLVTKYRAHTLICLRYADDPIRDFVLRTCRATHLYAATWVIRDRPLDSVPHEIRRHAWLLSSAGLPLPSARSLLPRFPTSRRRSSDRIVVAPFSSSPLKDWPDSAWVAVAAAFAHQPIRWELWVGPDQRAAAESLGASFRRVIDGDRVSIRSGSIANLAEAVATARLVISVDTLVVHLATAFDAPVVGLVGGGQYGNFVPWSHSDRQRWLSHSLPCYHCGWQCTQAQNDCLQLISPAEVMAEIERSFANAGSSPPADRKASRSSLIDSPV